MAPGSKPSLSRYKKNTLGKSDPALARNVSVGGKRGKEGREEEGERGERGERKREGGRGERKREGEVERERVWGRGCVCACVRV